MLIHPLHRPGTKLSEGHQFYQRPLVLGSEHFHINSRTKKFPYETLAFKCSHPHPSVVNSYIRADKPLVSILILICFTPQLTSLFGWYKSQEISNILSVWPGAIDNIFPLFQSQTQTAFFESSPTETKRWVSALAPFTSCVTWGKLFNLSKSQFLYLPV